MRIDVLTLFPEMFQVLDQSILGRAKAEGRYELHLSNIRDYAKNKHHQVDDTPYGGGAGMVMACQPVLDSIRAIRQKNSGPVIFLGPKGQTFNQQKAKRLSKLSGFTLLCGHYEGLDERIFSEVDEVISLGDFILTGGEMAALPVIDAVVRLLPGVLGSDESTEEESFQDGLLEYPHYTKPQDFEGMTIPEVLKSGHHEKIRKWRRAMSILETQKYRPDLYEAFQASKEDLKILRDFEAGKLV